MRQFAAAKTKCTESTEHWHGLANPGEELKAPLDNVKPVCTTEWQDLHVMKVHCENLQHERRSLLQCKRHSQMKQTEMLLGSFKS
jgi:hypothetical protein